MKYIREFAEYSEATDAAIELFEEEHGCPFVFDVDNNLEYNSGEGDYLTCYHYADGSVNVNRDQVPEGTISNSIIENYKTLTECYIGKYCTEMPMNAFRSCSALTSVSMQNVTSIGSSAFYYCTSLTSVSMPNVTSIGNYAFQNCKSLASVSMPNVESIASFAFYQCTTLTSVSMPNVTSIGGISAFYQCSALTSVYLPDIVPTLSNTNAFSGTHSTLKFYVSSQAVKDAYLAATNWKSFAADNYVVQN